MKTPDITPAQSVAIAKIIAALVAAFSLPLTAAQQGVIVGAVSVVASVLIWADARIRQSRVPLALKAQTKVASGEGVVRGGDPRVIRFHTSEERLAKLEEAAKTTAIHLDLISGNNSKLRAEVRLSALESAAGDYGRRLGAVDARLAEAEKIPDLEKLADQLEGLLHEYELKLHETPFSQSEVITSNVMRAPAAAAQHG